jgi:hypothetical protein
MNLAVLHYGGADDANPTVDPTTDIPTSSSPLVETGLHVSKLMGVMSPSIRLIPVLPSHLHLLVW